MDEYPDELRKKLGVLEGDKRAFFEATETVINNNTEVLNALRRENKLMKIKLKTLKVPLAGVKSGGSSDKSAVIEQRMCEQIKKHNRLRANSQNIELEIAQCHRIIELTENATQDVLDKDENGAITRELENRLDKAIIKTSEAQRIATTYQLIIAQLVDERSGYDAKIKSMEQAIIARRKDLKELEAMCADAVLARDVARKELATTEQDTQAARKERETTRKELEREAEERRRQYEAMERRGRLNNIGQVQATQSDETSSEEIREKIISFEGAMRRIQDVTGVTDTREVLARFLNQGETKDRLETLKAENTKTLAALRETYGKNNKQLESLRYSGDARQTGNQRLLAEFDEVLKQAKSKLSKEKDAEIEKMKLLVDVKTGIGNLEDKLDKISFVQFENPEKVEDKLKEAELRLAKLLGELEAKAAGLDIDPSVFALPVHNTRVPLVTDEKSGSESGSEEDDVISREAVKRNVQSLIDAKNKKPRKGKKKGRV